MGSQDTHSTTTQSSTSAPGEMTAPTVQGIINQLSPLIASSGLTPDQQNAINTLKANAAAGNPYAPQIGANASNLLSGGGATDQNGALTDNLATLKGTLGTYTDPNYSTINSPAVQRALQAAQADVSNSVNSQFAAAGRSGSGMNTDTLARGTTAAMAPIILNQANADTANRIGAATTLYGAGNTTAGAITGNNQTALGNKIAGVDQANHALSANNYGAQQTIAADELAKSIPAADLGMLAQIGIPLAGLNMTMNGNSTTDQSVSPSLLQTITGIGSMLGSGGGTMTGANGTSTSAGSGILGLLKMFGG